MNASTRLFMALLCVACLLVVPAGPLTGDVTDPHNKDLPGYDDDGSSNYCKKCVLVVVYNGVTGEQTERYECQNFGFGGGLKIGVKNCISGFSNCGGGQSCQVYEV